MKKCAICEVEITDKATTCSPRCKQALHRQRTVTPTVTKDGPTVTFAPTVTEPEVFEFTVPQKPEDIRTEKYWYNIPLAAQPIIQDGWPELPDYMTARQYFLWWKNDFRLATAPDKPGRGHPLLFNPGEAL